ncbi:ABC transporter ATP-binding protein [Ruminococcus albus]|uniref:Energy-coupling factor transport system ATP-binding protein n=1 Tax=Ruminococcus albus TaxID=1264 RepID=A0A1H7JQJ1_RUMAL|nr:ATP-binding cassette domain-containing protein [Ruminococcus albus]SEK76921.1 energy-coupling factor transport system ATP-binding protein [Ruminococcus albus]
MDAVHCEGLTFRYNNAKAPAIQGIDLKIGRGELVLLMGRSGCGKTTLLKLLKPEIAPLGEVSGDISVFGKKAESPMPMVGYAAQSPEDSFVSDTVYGEIMFAPENAGLSAEEVRRAAAETITRFGLGKLLRRKLDELSGGEKQLVSLCAALVMQPEILLLDEPFSRLDPVTAEDISGLILRLNREMGTTVIIAEHTTDLLFAECDRVVFMENGQIAADASPREMCKVAGAESFLPAAARIFSGHESCPLTVREGRKLLGELPHKKEVALPEVRKFGEEALRADDLRFALERRGEDILDGVDILLHKGEHLALIGANGCGKTTLLRCLAGLCRAYSGTVKVFGKRLKKPSHVIAMLPQEARDIFVQPTVREDYIFALKAMEKPIERADEMLRYLGCGHLADIHPYDLSGGETQLCALGRVLLCEPEILLLDEPVKGLDAVSRKKFGEMIKRLCGEGKAVLTVTHDLENAAELADSCAILCGGRVESLMPAGEFFARAGSLSTAAGRIARGEVANAYTVERLRSALRGSCP